MVNVVADDREPNDLIDYLARSTTIDNVDKQRLPVGDYVGGGAAIERKTPTDLEGSLGNRFFGQMQDLADNYEFPVLIIHGHPWEMFAWSRSRPQRKHYGYIGALARTVSMGVAVLVAFDDREFRSMVAKICDKAGTNPDFERPINVSKSGRDLEDVRNDILCAVDGVSRERAGNLLDKYGHVAGVAVQPVKTLKQVEGVGPATAWNIRDAFAEESTEWLEARDQLASVNGVTRQTAHEVLHLVNGDVDRLANTDKDNLTRLDGVGAKTAERLQRKAGEANAD